METKVPLPTVPARAGLPHLRALRDLLTEHSADPQARARLALVLARIGQRRALWADVSRHVDALSEATGGFEPGCLHLSEEERVGAVTLAATAYARTGRIADAAALLDGAVGREEPGARMQRADVLMLHDPARAVEDLAALSASEEPLTERAASMLAYLNGTVLGLSPDPREATQSEGEASIAFAAALAGQGEHRAARELLNRFHAEHDLEPPLDVNDGPLSFDDFRSGKPDPHDGPLATVVMTCFDSEETLPRAARSILAQSHSNLELLLVDDASRDGTLELAHGLAREDSRVKVIALPTNVGAYAARNVALTQARGEFLTFHDSDDWAHPQRLERQIRLMEQDPDLAATMSSWIRCDPAGMPQFRRWQQAFVHSNPASAMYRAHALARVGPFDEVRFGADTEHWQRTRAALGKRATRVLKTPLGFGLVRDDSLTRSGAGDMGAHHYSAALAAYRASWVEWHLADDNPTLPWKSDGVARPFWAPRPALQHADDVPTDAPDDDIAPVVFTLSAGTPRARARLARNLQALERQTDPRWIALVASPHRPAEVEPAHPRVIYVGAGPRRRPGALARHAIASASAWRARHVIPLDARTDLDPDLVRSLHEGRNPR